MSLARRITSHRLLAGAMALLIIGAASSVWMLARADSGSANPDDPAQVARGAQIYSEHCARCHGAQLDGQGDWRTRLPSGRLPAPPHDASGHTWHHPDDTLFRLTKFGLVPPLAPDGYVSDMPAFQHVLSDQEIWAVLSFIKSEWPRSLRERHKAMRVTK